METKANYVLIGAFTLVLSIGLLAFGLWAAKYSSDRSWQVYRVVFNEAVTGLSVGSSVQYNGIAVGSIIELNLANNDPGKVIARIRLNAATPIKTDTRAKLAMTSLTGPTIIQLSGGTPRSQTLTAIDESEEPMIKSSPSALQNITDTATHLVERLDKILSANNVASIERTLHQVDRLTAAVANDRDGLPQLLTETHATLQAMQRALANTNQTVTTLNQSLSQHLPVVLDHLDTTLAAIQMTALHANTILNENRTAVHSFANDGLGQLGPTLSELRGLIGDLRQVSDRLNTNPARYLLGRETPQEFTPP